MGPGSLQNTRGSAQAEGHIKHRAAKCQYHRGCADRGLKEYVEQREREASKWEMFEESQLQ